MLPTFFWMANPLFLMPLWLALPTVRRGFTLAGAEWAWMPKPPVTLAVSIAICAAARAIFFPRYVP